ncbi:MAG: sigma-70 family RNA polymerase sigma factor [Planctomycetota bacterium]
MEDWASVLKTGASEAWNDFVSRYSGMIYNVFCNKSFGFAREEIEDNFNEFFYGLIKNNFHKIRLFEGRNHCSFPTYLKKIALNQAIDAKKRRIKNWAYSLNETWSGKNQDEGQELGDRLANSQAVPIEDLLTREQRNLFCHALYQLPPEKLLVVIMIAYHNYDRVKLGKLLKTTRQNIDVIYNRTKEKLRELVGCSSATAEGPQTPWRQDLCELKEKILLGNRMELLKRCVDKLHLPEQLLVGLVFLDSLSLYPTPERLAALLKCKLDKSQDLAFKVLEKVVVIH